MKTFRSSILSMAVLFLFMFCFGTSLQAATVEETEDLDGPETAARSCDGDTVGEVSIEGKKLSLAEKINSFVFKKDKSSDQLTVKVRFRGGVVTPDTTFNVMWAQPAMAGECYQMGAENREKIGELTTSGSGSGRGKYRLRDGNPFPGSDGAVIILCLPDAGDADLCTTFATPDERYTAIFSTTFAP